MPLHRFLLILLSVILILPGNTIASDSMYNYMNAMDLESRLTDNRPTNIVDIQVEEEFSRHHIKGAIPTHAYPVKSETDRAKLDGVIEQLNTNADPVVIVCPRGEGGAKRTYDHLLQQGVLAERLLILEKGQSGWNFTALTKSK